VSFPGATYNALSLHISASHMSFWCERRVSSEAEPTYLGNAYIVYEGQDIASSCPPTAVPISLAMDWGMVRLAAAVQCYYDGGKCGRG
jgi:hypothetical protein